MRITSEAGVAFSVPAPSHNGPNPRTGLPAFTALCTIARLHQVAADPATLAHQLGLAPTDPLGIDDLLRAAQHLGLKAKLSRSSVERLALTPLPALALMRSECDALQVVIVAQCDGKRVLLQSGQGAPTILPVDDFAQA